MARAFVAVGSNIDPAENVIRALRLLAERVRVTGVSTVYLTEPVGRPGQEPYYNCVVSVETGRAPLDVKRGILRKLEDDLGRVRTADKSASRTIDLDLILYGDAVAADEELTLPDPDILRRPFLALSLAELAPELVIPGTNGPVSQMVVDMNRSGMKPLPDFTERLKKELLP